MVQIPTVRDPSIYFLLNWVRDPVSYLKRLHRRYGDVFRKDIRGHMHYFPVHPLHAKQVLSTRQDIYDKHPLLVNNFEPFLGTNSLLTSNNIPQWERDRKLAKTAFDSKLYFDRYGKQVAKRTEALVKRLLPVRGERQQTVEIGPLIDAFALENINDTIFHDIDVDTEAMVEHVPQIFKLVVKKATALLPFLWSLPIGAARRYRDEVDFIAELKRSVVAGRLARHKDYDDLLGTLMHDYGVTDERSPEFASVGNQMMTFNLVGYTSTTSALRWMVTMFSLHPDAQETVAEEVGRVCGGRTPSTADMPQLVYTRAFLSEMLRMYPPLVFLTRQSTSDDDLDGHPIHRDDCVILDAYHINRHPEFWTEPESFDPTRFLSKPHGQDEPFSYIPFGGGRRSCIGMQFALLELVIVAAIVLQHVRLRLPNDFDLSLRYVASVFIRPNLDTITIRRVD